MTVRTEDFTTREPADRVYYETGVFLDAEDLRAEQTYHRGRLARVLTYVHGSGTLAGLRVTWDSDHTELRVLPGVAIDRLGRLIEVPRTACVNLQDWFTAMREEALEVEADGVTHALREAFDLVDDVVRVDVFARFVVCERGRTPSFATGPYDAIDASQPHRLRDSYELSLELRGTDGTLPENPFPARGAYTAEEHLEAIRDHILEDAWFHGSEWADDKPPSESGVDGVDDTTSVFLARVEIPVAADGDTGLPEWTGPPETPDAPAVDNHLRRFVLPTQALVRLIDAAMESP